MLGVVWSKYQLKPTFRQLISAKVSGDCTIFPENCIYIFVTSHNFFSLSSVQIIIIPACCLLCVL